VCTKKNKVIRIFIAGFLCLNGMVSRAQQTKQSFTVADEIGLTLFYDMEGGVQFSPDGKYFAVHAQRGRLDLNRSEDTLRFYRSQDAENFLKHSDNSQPPYPIWVVNHSGKEGPSIAKWRWLGDSSGVAFLRSAAGGNQQLVVADPRNKRIEPLTSATEMVGTFDIRDRSHYAYTIVDEDQRERLQEKTKAERQSPAIVGTGRPFSELVLPDDPLTIRLSSPRSNLWAVVGAKHFEVKHDSAPIVPNGSLALSPDGNFLVTRLRVSEVPSSWETLYPPSYPSDPYRLQLSHSAHQYVRIDVRTGSIQSLTDAPVSRDGGGWANVFSDPSWSSNGQEILLPGTFIKSKDHAPSRPCVAVVDLLSNSRTCVEMLRGSTDIGVEEGYHSIRDVRFVGGGGEHRITVNFYTYPDYSVGTTEYQKNVDGAWQRAAQVQDESKTEHNGVKVTVKQGLNDPPLLVATTKQISRVIWDPNPQLKKFELGQVSVYTWRDKKGRELEGGLYKPINYKLGQRYPLVIQTHGFMVSVFQPAGTYPTAFAARALAAAGVMVLQVGERCHMGALDEGLCAVSDYETAVDQLVAEGLVDKEKIGIIGFSRTCFYVMEALTTGSLHFKAASITDGGMASYLEYMMFGPISEYDSMIGAKPFGEGLQQWLKRSPNFNLDKVTAPLLVVGGGPLGVLSMWEPYAGLRNLQKPVELIMLNTHEHVLSNPAVRMASQGGSVDWFRFWLQDYEDLDPAKAEQYTRWRELRKMQAENEKKLATSQPSSN